MKASDLLRSAIGNTFRSRTRTILTVLAIFVGAFTLTLTNGIGTGVNRYIDDTLSAIGADNVMTVVKSEGATMAPQSGPVEYDPDAVGSEIPGATTGAITPADLTILEGIAGVTKVEPVRTVTLDYIQQGQGSRWVASTGSLVPGQTLQLEAGAAPDAASDELQVAIPTSYLEPLGFTDADAAVGQPLTLVLTDAAFTQHTLTATITGVSESTLGGMGGSSIVPNQALTTELYQAQQTGLPTDKQDRWSQVTVWFDPDAATDQEEVVKQGLTKEGFTGVTTADQLGAFTTVIDTIVTVLNGFSVIALIAAGFGIVNTLLMSVQERTREIGLMKAMGMSSPRVFTLFSLEAVFIGFLGSVLGSAVAIAVGTAISDALSTSLLADLPGLQLIAFSATSVLTVTVVIMAVAFLAGSLPAVRAARKDPVDALRYE